MWCVFLDQNIGTGNIEKPNQIQFNWANNNNNNQYESAKQTVELSPRKFFFGLALGLDSPHGNKKNKGG